MKKIQLILIFVFSFVTKMLIAQNATIADTLITNEKLYTVIAVLGIILLGIFIFLISLEKKIKKLEQEIK